MLYKIAVIFIFSFKFLFTLNNTSNPTPAFASNPAIKIEAVIKFSTYNLVIITEDAQFGIKPINPAITGPKILLFIIKLDNVSSPIKCITRFKTNVIISINIKILIG